MDQTHIDIPQQTTIDAEPEIEELSLDEFRLLFGLVVADSLAD